MVESYSLHHTNILDKLTEAVRGTKGSTLVPVLH